jgi:tRNA A-37 threonylcarbamoyl transferase component Bud32
VVTRGDPQIELIGQRCGGSYRVTALIGEGGMGQVYRASSEMLAGEQAAVKVLLHQLLRRPESLARFRAEVYAAGKIKDQNIVKVFDAGTFADGRHYMLMEYCSGGSLSDLLEQRGPLPLDLCISIVAAIGSALDAAHAANITHRDVKPANILLVQETGGLLRAKLSDFGIVKLHDAHLELGMMMTGTSKTMGSPGYMAPEQCMGKGASAADSRADVYAFGTVIYEMVTGRRPYPGTSMFDLINDVVANAPFPRPSELRRDLPPQWDNVIMGALEHRREDRIQSIKELVVRLARSIPNGEALMSYVAPRLVTNVTAPTAATIADGIGPAAAQWAAHSTMGNRRTARVPRTLVVFAIGAAVAGGAAALAFRAGSRSREHAPVAAGTATDDPIVTVEPYRSSNEGQVVDAPAIATRVDAGLDVAAIARAQDARVAVAVVPEKPPRHAERPARTAQAPAEPGTLRIEVEPWADVAISGQKETYTTPVTTMLPAGPYRVVLTKGTRKETVEVTITPNQTTRIERSW